MEDYVTSFGDLIRVKELAMIIRLSRARTYALVHKGVIPSVKIGGSIRVPRAAYEQWLKAQTAKALGTATGTAVDNKDE